MCGQVLDVNMVSEPKAHVTKGKAIKRQKDVGELEQLMIANPHLSTYYMDGGSPSFTTTKRPRVEETNGETNFSEM